MFQLSVDVAEKVPGVSGPLQAGITVYDYILYMEILAMKQLPLTS